jgi:putative membrane protein
MMMGFGMMGGMLILWIVLAGLAGLMARGLFQSKQPGVVRNQLSARQVLEERYARGEISREQYLLMLKDLLE